MQHLTPALSAYAAGRTIAPLWVSPSGRAFYPIAGGSQDPNPAPDPTPNPPADPTPDPKDPPADPGKTFTQADVDRIIAGRLSKYADYDDVKKQLGEIQAANQTESEKAINAAKAEGRKEAAVEVAREAFNGLAARRNDEYDAAPALALIDLGKFVKDDGTLDRDSLKTAVEQIVPEKEERKPAPSFGGGARRTGNDKPDVTPGVGRLRSAYADTAK